MHGHTTHAASPADVDLSIICAFNRMKTKLKLSAEVTPTTVPAGLVAAAAEALRGSQAVEINAEGTRVKRKAPLRDPEEVKKENDARSVYVRPLPMDASIDALTEFFSAHGTVNCVTMRRTSSPRGSR
jgi:lupus La protein